LEEAMTIRIFNLIQANLMPLLRHAWIKKDTHVCKYLRDSVVTVPLGLLSKVKELLSHPVKNFSISRISFYSKPS